MILGLITGTYVLGLLNLAGTRPDLILDNTLFFAGGVLLFFVARFLRFNFFRENALPLYLFFLLLVILTFFIGETVKGSTRWINLYFFNLQPSEFMKIIMVLFLSSIISTKTAITNRSSLLLYLFPFILIPFFLIAKQPDLGTAVVLLFSSVVMLIFSPIPKMQLVKVAVVLVATMPLIWFQLHQYQKDRILSFIDRGQNVSTTSYNMNQAIISVGSGGVVGTGLGLGKQSRLYFLPEYYTDFAFSSYIEQFGFIGGLLLLTLYAALFAKLFYMTYRLYKNDQKKDLAPFYYTLGFTTIMCMQTVVNISMNMGLLPIAGITLPFISYGGSSMVSLLIGAGMLPKA